MKQQRRFRNVSLAVTMVLLAGASASAATFTGTVTSSDPTMNVVSIVDPNCGGQIPSPVHYDFVAVSTSVSAPYTFTLSSTGNAASFYLYQTSFNPAAGATNCIAASNANKRFTEPLNAGTNYVIVIINDDVDQTLSINWTVNVMP